MQKSNFKVHSTHLVKPCWSRGQLQAEIVILLQQVKLMLLYILLVNHHFVDLPGDDILRQIFYFMPWF